MKNLSGESKRILLTIIMLSVVMVFMAIEFYYQFQLSPAKNMIAAFAIIFNCILSICLSKKSIDFIKSVRDDKNNIIK